MPRAPSASPATAALIISSPPQACTETQRAPSAPSCRAAARTVLGMSASLASAKTGFPRRRIAATVAGPGPIRSSRPTLKPPTWGASRSARRRASSAVGRSRATRTGFTGSHNGVTSGRPPRPDLRSGPPRAVAEPTQLAKDPAGGPGLGKVNGAKPNRRGPGEQVLDDVASRYHSPAADDRELGSGPVDLDDATEGDRLQRWTRIASDHSRQQRASGFDVDCRRPRSCWSAPPSPLRHRHKPGPPKRCPPSSARASRRRAQSTADLTASVTLAESRGSSAIRWPSRLGHERLISIACDSAGRQPLGHPGEVLDRLTHRRTPNRYRQLR